MSYSTFPSTSTRRRVLQLLGITAAGGALQPVSGKIQENPQSFSVVQDDECIPVEPFSGDDPVEEVYDYHWPHDRYTDGPPGTDSPMTSSMGTVDLQQDDTSILFLYKGPEGLSLVIVHGRAGSDEDAGGTVSFTIHGLPVEGLWVVGDDLLFDEDGELATPDRWYIDDNPHEIHWVYEGFRTDGGAFRDIGSEFEIEIEPAFNEESYWEDRFDFGPIENWEILSGDRDDPERHSLELDQNVVIRDEPCPSNSVVRSE